MNTQPSEFLQRIGATSWNDAVLCVVVYTFLIFITLTFVTVTALFVGSFFTGLRAAGG